MFAKFPRNFTPNARTYSRSTEGFKAERSGAREEVVFFGLIEHHREANPVTGSNKRGGGIWRGRIFTGIFSRECSTLRKSLAAFVPFLATVKVSARLRCFQSTPWQYPFSAYFSVRLQPAGVTQQGAKQWGLFFWWVQGGFLCILKAVYSYRDSFV